VGAMMIFEKDAGAREGGERGSVFWRDEIRPHSIPDNQDDVVGFAVRRTGGDRMGEAKGDETKNWPRHPPESLHGRINIPGRTGCQPVSRRSLRRLRGAEEDDQL